MAIVLACVLLFGSCKEEFPPYAEPDNVLSARVELTAPDTVEVFFDVAQNRFYLLSVLALKVFVTNTHDDLLQGPARIDGTITIQSFAAVPRVLLVPLTLGNLRTPPVFQGNVAVGPNRSAEFSELWIPQALDGRMAFHGHPHQRIGDVELYDPIDFIATARVQLFERVQPVQSGELRFTLVFRVTLTG